MNLGDLIAKLGIDTSGIDKAQQVYKNFGTQIDSVTKNVQSKNKAVSDSFHNVENATKNSGVGFVNLGHQIQNFATHPLEAARSGLTSILETMGPTAIAFGAISAGAIAAGVALFKMGESAAEEAKQLENLSMMTGLSTQKLQALDQMAKEAGVEGIDLGRILGKLNAELAIGEAGDFKKGLREFGISIRDTSGNVREISDLLSEVQKKLLDIPSATDRAVKANQVLGGRLRMMIPLLLQSNVAFKDQIEIMEKTGPVWDDITQKKLMSFHEAMEMISRTWSTLTTSIKSAVGGAFGRAFENFGQLAEVNIGKASSSMEKFNQMVEQGLIKVEKLPIALSNISPFTNIDTSTFLGPTRESLQDFETRMTALAERTQISVNLIIQLTKAEKDYKDAVELVKDSDTDANRKKLQDTAAIVAQVHGLIDAENALRKVMEEELGDIEGRQKKLKANAQEFGNLMSIVLYDPNKTAQVEAQITRDLEKNLNERSQMTEESIQDTMDENEKVWDVMTKKLLSDGEVWMDQIERQQEAYEKMISTVRDEAGSVFDAMIASGKFSFMSLFDWIKGFFLTRLRTLFQNFMEMIFSGGKKGLAGMLQGVIPNLGGGGGASGSWGEGAGEGSSGIFGLSGKASSLVQGGLMIGGMGLLGMAGSKGAKGWVGSIGGGAAMGASIGSMIPGIGTAVGAAIGAAAGAIGKGISAIGDAMTTSTYEHAVEVAGRDYGIRLTEEAAQEVYDSLGLSEEAAHNVTKQVGMSPVMIQKMAELAKQQGKMDTFMNNLANTSKQWGQNLAPAVQKGLDLGDWSELDKIFKNLMQNDKTFGGLSKILPDWKEKLLILGDQAAAAAKQFQELYNAAKETGRISPEFQSYMEKNKDLLEEAAKSSNLLQMELNAANKALQNMKEHAGEIAELDALANGFNQIKSALENYTPAASSSIQLFIDQGTITDDLRKKVEKFGGSMENLEKVAGLLKTNVYFRDLIENFKKTGEIMPDMIKIFQQFGGDISVLDKAVELKGLNQSISDIEKFKNSISNLIPETTGLQDALEGIWNADTARKLFLQGLDPAMFAKITPLITGLQDWADAVNEFQETGKLTIGGVPQIARDIIQKAGLTASQLKNVESMFKGSKTELTESGKLITSMLSQYGGAEGKIAVERLNQGFNTITTGLLTKTRTAMEQAYKTERDGVLAYLSQAQGQIQKQADDIQAIIESQFQIVSDNIAKAFADARVSAIEELDKIIAKIGEVTKSTIGLSQAETQYSTPAKAAEASKFPKYSWMYWQEKAASASGSTKTLYEFYLERARWNEGYWNPTMPGVKGPFPEAAKGGYIRVHDQEVVLDSQQTRNLFRGNESGIGGGNGTVVHIYNPTINNWQEFLTMFRKAGIELKSRGVVIA